MGGGTVKKFAIFILKLSNLGYFNTFEIILGENWVEQENPRYGVKCPPCLLEHIACNRKTILLAYEGAFLVLNICCKLTSTFNQLLWVVL